MKTTISMIALAVALLFTGCEAYVTEHRRPVRTYGYHGHGYYAGDHYRPYYRSSGYYGRSYYGHRRTYHRPSATVVVGRSPYHYGRVRWHR